MSKQIDALKLALEALEGLEALLSSMGLTHLIVYGDAKKAITVIREALADYKPTSDHRMMENAQGELERIKLVQTGVGIGKPEHSAPHGEPVAKLQVTLEDRPIDIELAQYKRMFEAACSDLGAINDALGLDPNDGGAEPILFAIEELKGRSQEPVAWMVYTLDGTSVCVTDNPSSFTPEHRALPLYTHPPVPTAQPKEPEQEPAKLWCDTCEGTGKVYQEHQAGCHVGGDFECPDCDGKGYIVSRIYAITPQQPKESEQEPASGLTPKGYAVEAKLKEKNT